jgi:3-oxoacyl-[acyl-carrier protein] reductase
VVLGSLCAREPHRVIPLVLHNVARAGQVALAKTYANDLAAHGITVNTIATGMMDHDGQAAERAYSSAARLGLSEAEVTAYRIGAVPAKRAGRADELGALCAFLASDRAGYITGQTILLDGGRVASLT